MMHSVDIPLMTRIRHRIIRWLVGTEPIVFNTTVLLNDNLTDCYLYNSPVQIIGNNTQIIGNIIRFKRGSKVSAITLQSALDKET